MITIERIDEFNISLYDSFLNNNSESVCQQTHEWMKVIKDITNDKPIFLIAKEEGHVVGAFPSYLFKNDLGNIIVSIPHAGPYGGIISVNKNKDEIYSSIFNEILKIAKAENCCLITIITPPFFSDIDLYSRTFKPDYCVENFFQFIHLDNFKIKRDVRRRLEQSQQNNLEISGEPSEKNILEWYEIHKKRMTELNARPIPLDIFLNASKSNISKFFFVKHKDIIISGAMFIFHKDVIDIYMMSADSNHVDLYPNFLLVNHAIEWAKLKGFKYFNWQSSPSRESGTYTFKERWGSIESKHHILTKVIGDADTILKTPLLDIKKIYAWHYVMPYSLWGEKQK